MRPIRALIVDDEPWARERIRALIEDEPSVEIAGESRSGSEAVRAIRELAPDLVFLDVQMPDLDGFEVIAEIGPSRMPAVVFVTAYDQHALRAFEVHALDYLLKPFDRRRFYQAVERAASLIRAGRVERQLEHLEGLMADVASRPRCLERLLVRAHGRMFFVHVDKIDWIEAAGNYVRVHTGGKSHLVRQTMKVLEQELDAVRFLRIHRSTIVNLDRVREISPLFSGEYSVVLVDGTRLTLSKGYRDRLRSFLTRP